MPTAPASSLSRRLYPLLYLLVLTTGALAIWIATTTRPNSHPDEFVHADAFCYYERHWWPPPLNADGLRYSPYGWSRVYGGEVVYILYGQAGRLLKPVLGEGGLLHRTPIITGDSRLFLPLVLDSNVCVLDYRLYRLLNCLLWVVTLTTLLVLGRRHTVIRALALLLCSLPQVVYLYSYANSDAWAVTTASLLFAYAWTQRAHPFGSPRDAILFGTLTGLLLLSKQTLWVSLPFSLAVWLLRSDFPPLRTLQGIGTIARGLAIAALMALVIVLPLHVIYPATQPEYARQVEEMREQRARWDLRPSAPVYPGYRLAARGVPLRAALTPDWVTMSLESFYGRFGSLDVRLPGWIYPTAGILLALGAGTTVVGAFRNRRRWVWQDQLLLGLTPVALLLPVAASLYNSWVVDWQPQGRYLYAALLPLALLMAGRAPGEARRLRRLRVLLWALLLGLSHYALLITFVTGHALR